MRAVVVWSALLVFPIAASAECQASLSAGMTALSAYDAVRAETAFRAAEKQCASQESAAQLAGLLYDRSLREEGPKRAKLLREAWGLVARAFERGATNGDLLTIRAAIAGDLAQVSDSTTEQAELLLAVHADATRARALDPDSAMPLVVLGAWHRNAAALDFSERMFVRMVAGPLPDASLEESRRLLELAVKRERSPLTLFFLGATRHEQGDRKGARELFASCARTEPRSLRDAFVREWCRDRVAPR